MLASNGSLFRSTVVAEGGVEAAMAAMAVGPLDATLQEVGCAALASMAFCEEGRAEMEERGALELTLLALRNHKQLAEVQTAGVVLLANLSHP